MCVNLPWILYICAIELLRSIFENQYANSSGCSMQNKHFCPIYSPHHSEVRLGPVSHQVSYVLSTAEQRQQHIFAYGT